MNAYKYVYQLGVDTASDMVRRSQSGFITYEKVEMDCNEIYQALDDIKTVNDLGGYWRANEIIARGVYKFGSLKGTNHEHIPEVFRRIESHVDVRSIT